MTKVTRSIIPAKPAVFAALVAQAIGSMPLNAQVALSSVSEGAGARILLVQQVDSPMEAIPAQLVIEDVGGSARIRSAGKLRMLSQRISAAACNISAGVAAEMSAEVLTATKTEFRAILDGLTNGNDALGMFGPEKRRLTLVEIEAVTVLWNDFEAAVDGVLAGTEMAANIDYIAANNEALLKQANLLVSEISGEYSNPAEMTQAKAMMVDISARQRMLTQKVAKEVCGVASGNAAMGDPEKLAKTMDLFEVSLNALRGGMPEAGIGAAPTPEIKAVLDASWEDWQRVKAEIAKVVETGSADAETQALIFDLMNAKLGEIDKASGLYSEYARSTL
ncbi:MAG: hypothetical protein HC844_11975 [Tabrizicola sp.]|nr:hypothetical protein [Tabrizicola sp.]